MGAVKEAPTYISSVGVALSDPGPSFQHTWNKEPTREVEMSDPPLKFRDALACQAATLD
jgi:hypothetical protein